MDKELEIRKMLEYLARKVYSVTVKGNVFQLEHSFGIDIKPVPNRDNHNFTIDFDSRTIKVYSYDESHHNGDHYNCINSNLEWNYLYGAYNTIKSYLHPHIEKEVLDEWKTSLINKKLLEILGD